MSGHHPDICWFCHHIICYFVCREWSSRSAADYERVWIVSVFTGCEWYLCCILLQSEDRSYLLRRYGITSYAPVFEYVCNGTAYHEQTTLTVPYRLLRRMTEGNTYPIYIHSKHPGVYVLKRRIRFTTVIEFGFAIMFLVVAILWQQSWNGT